MNLGVVMHALIPVDRGRGSGSPGVQGQPGLQRELQARLSQKKEREKKGKQRRKWQEKARRAWGILKAVLRSPCGRTQAQTQNEVIIHRV